MNQLLRSAEFLVGGNGNSLLLRSGTTWGDVAPKQYVNIFTYSNLIVQQLVSIASISQSDTVTLSYSPKEKSHQRVTRSSPWMFAR